MGWTKKQGQTIVRNGELKMNRHRKQKITVMNYLNCNPPCIVIWRVTVLLFVLGLIVGTPGCDIGEEKVDDFIEVHNPKTLPARLAAQRIGLGIGYKPCIARLPSGELLVVAFSKKKVEGGNILEDEVLYRSSDGGKTWSGPEVLDLPGCEPYLTVLKDGTIFITSNLLAHDVRNNRNYAYSYLHRSQDGGHTWNSTQIVPKEFRSVSSITTRNVLEMDDGSLMIGISEHRIKNSKSCIWVSSDKGKTWGEKYPAHFEDVPKDYPYTIMGEAYLWQAGYKIYTILTVGVHKSWTIPGTTETGGNDNTERMVLYSSMDKGRNWEKIRDLGDYGQYVPVDYAPGRWPGSLNFHTAGSQSNPGCTCHLRAGNVCCRPLAGS